MRLTDEANIADRGIDIVASPPGKRLQNVLLLSGGEKALTAMALLMAIFRYQPSPFCILDEVDAPLDEANIERLTRLLQRDVAPDAVHRDHALQADHGSGAGAVRRDHAGARRVEAGQREVQSAAGAGDAAADGRGGGVAGSPSRVLPEHAQKGPPSSGIRCRWRRISCQTVGCAMRVTAFAMLSSTDASAPESRSVM